MVKFFVVLLLLLVCGVQAQSSFAQVTLAPQITAVPAPVTLQGAT